MYLSHLLGRKTYLLGILVVLGSLLFSMPSKIFAQNEPIIQSDSAILMDAKTGTILYEKNIHKKQFPASITKIMTALLAVEYGNLEDTITFSRNAVYSIEWGSSHIGMGENEQISFKDALYGMLLMSANEVSNGIAEHIDGSVDEFAKHMTKRAKELGANNTNFVNPHGLHDETHYTTAYDMALIAREALQYDVFREIIGTVTYTIPPTNIVEEPRYLAHQHKLFNQKAYPSSYYNGCEGGKTGFTNEAQHTLITYAKRNDMELISVTLKAEKQQMYDDTKNLLDYGFDNFEIIPILKQKSLLTTVPVISIQNNQKEFQDKITVYNESDFNCVLQKGASEKDIIKKLSIPKELNEPIDENEVVGTVDFVFQNKIIGQVNLIASESIAVLQSVSANTIEEEIISYNPSNKYVRIFITIGSTLLILFTLFITLCIVRNYQRKQRRKIYRSNNRLHFSKYLQKK